MYLELQKQLAGHLRSVLQSKYSIEIENVPVEIPPDLKFGELATPIALQLARTLRKAPKVIAQEIVEALGTLPGFAGFEVAGAGYINARLDRTAGVRAVVDGDGHSLDMQDHVLVEHTSINPNKAAHIGHLRNAILGDTFVRLLRAAGNQVDVQNYIDNTGVQVADVVVGFLHLEGKSLAEVRRLLEELKTSGERVDYYCWDLYARTSQWYEQGSAEENAERKKFRYATLHEIEQGGNETAEVADLISTAVLRRHLETMLRLDIEYDFLPRESEILHLKFWDVAFEQLKQTGVLYFETEGKNKGCWVMRRPGAEIAEGELDEDAKVIVRSNGTVTYVGKDIAYHLWKFGLLGRDFGYKKFFKYPDHECWISTEHGEAEHPHFGGATAIYNVIDSRQSDPQANVIQALRGMGHTAQADHYTHFSYEMVALTPRCAVDLGYTVSDEDLSRPYIEVSGRKGFGVKADDLIDKLIAATREEVEKRQTSREEAERQKIAEQVAIGALRYFMLKFTRNSVIAFDFKDALSFEGETGPYAQYAAVRIRNIFRKGGTTPKAELARLAEIDELESYLSGEENEDIWALWLRAGRRSLVLDQAIGASEPAYLAKHVFQLAQEFNNFYHKHHILTEEDPAKKTFLLATAAVALRELMMVLGWLGIETPEAM
ncbi:arginine--tRNA ligase [Terracidiphilus gabretensis]|uniref:arginine--tRNA ligase n=1 Tax=Terracidiphilus gabretensis TaxID=1577687 RepID=UPI00071BDAEC|nr:arginine--tRNA ligase [Terracidiphilus gabretensis]